MLSSPYKLCVGWESPAVVFKVYTVVKEVWFVRFNCQSLISPRDWGPSVSPGSARVILAYIFNNKFLVLSRLAPYLGVHILLPTKLRTNILAYKGDNPLAGHR